MGILQVFKNMWVWHLGIWFSADPGGGGAGLLVGLRDLRGLFQPEQFHDSVLLLGSRGSRTSCGKHSEPLAANFRVEKLKNLFLCFAVFKFQN